MTPDTQAAPLPAAVKEYVLNAPWSHELEGAPSPTATPPPAVPTAPAADTNE